MRRILIDAGIAANRRPSHENRGSPPAPRSWVQRLLVASWLAIGFVLSSTSAAPAFTLKLTFSDGQPMTHGSACVGDGCLARSAGIRSADANGEVRLPDEGSDTVEFRRDGIDLAQVPEGSAAGRVSTAGGRATVVLPRLLLGSAPAVDALESEIVARINEARAAHGLAPAAVNERLSAAADLHATWLDTSAVGLPLPILSHRGPVWHQPRVPPRRGFVPGAHDSLRVRRSRLDAGPGAGLLARLRATPHPGSRTRAAADRRGERRPGDHHRDPRAVCRLSAGRARQRRSRRPRRRRRCRRRSHHRVRRSGTAGRHVRSARRLTGRRRAVASSWASGDCVLGRGVCGCA